LPFDTRNIDVLNNIKSSEYEAPNALVAGWGMTDGE
jgi:hypothetical protein